MTDDPRLAFRDEVIATLRRDLTEGEHGLLGVPNAVKLVIRDEMWRERVVHETGQVATFATFADFVTALPPKGLGANLDLLLRICASDHEALQAIDQATAGEHGGDRRSNGFNVKNLHVEEGGRPAGESRQRAIRKLRTEADREDADPAIVALRDEVLAGRKSATAAMVAAGFWRPKTSVYTDRPDDAVRALLKHFDASELIAALKRATGG